MKERTEKYINDLESQNEELRRELTRDNQDSMIFQQILDKVIDEIHDKYDDEYQAQVYDPATEKVVTAGAIERKKSSGCG